MGVNKIRLRNEMMFAEKHTETSANTIKTLFVKAKSAIGGLVTGLLPGVDLGHTNKLAFAAA